MKRLMRALVFVVILIISSSSLLISAGSVIDFGITRDYYNKYVFDLDMSVDNQDIIDYESKIKHYSKKMRIKNFTSSNKKVVNASNKSLNEVKGWASVIYYGSGHATVTADIYKGKKYIKSLWKRYLLFKYKNPFKKLKIGKRSFRKDFKYETQPNVYIGKAIKGKLKYKLRKGFRIKKIKLEKNRGTSKIKNGSFVRIPKPVINNYTRGYDIFFKIYDKKHKITKDYYLIFAQ